jgi:outer membrane biosynthesis protein TonB
VSPLSTAPQREWLRLVAAFPLALLAHGLGLGLFLGVSALTHVDKPPPKPKPQPVAFRYVDSRQYSNNRGRTAPPDERRAPLHPKGQVVDVARGNNQIAPDAKYLAETNNRVKKETRAREQTNKYSVATAKTTEHPELMPAAKGAVGGQRAKEAANATLERFLNGMRQKYSLMPEKGQAGVQNPVEETNKPGLENGETDATRSGDVAESGGGAPNDDLQNVPAGDGTALNTREWKYASFFNRVKQAVTAKWNPNGKMSTHSQAEVGYADRQTVLVITLRPDGSLVEAYVAKSCGLDWLDQESVQAFEHAQPFPNPPAALVEGGIIRFQFGFTVTNQDLGLPGMLRPAPDPWRSRR